MILVTGATGTVGRELVPQLLKRGQEVRAMSRTREKASALFCSGVEVVRGDFDDRTSLQAAIDGVERVFLLTAQMGGRPPTLRSAPWQRRQACATSCDCQCSRRAAMKMIR